MNIFNLFRNPQVVVLELAQEVCWNYNTGKPDHIVWKSLNKLYSYVQKKSGKLLIALPSEVIAQVGCAFSIYALCYQADNDDRDFNSVSAENAYYCFMKAYLENNNELVIPALFSLLWGPEDLLEDRFVAFDELKNIRNIGGPVKLIYMQQRRLDLWEQYKKKSINKRLLILRYLLDFFYDVRSKEYLLPNWNKDFLVPSKEHIESFLEVYSTSDFAQEKEYSLIAKEYMLGVYESCKSVLMKY